MKEKLELYIKENLKNDKLEKHGLFGKLKNLFYYDNDSNEDNNYELSKDNKKNFDYSKNQNFDQSYTIDDELNVPIFLKRHDEISTTSDINKFIEKHENDYNDFQTTLFNMIDERNLKDNEVYNKVHIDRRLFSKIRSGKNYHPSKETILLLGFSLELNEEEIEKLLDSASYSLPKNNHYDLIIRFCFINKIYKLTDINNLLDQYNCKLFSY